MNPEQLDAESGAVDSGVADPAIRVVNLTLGFGAKTVLDQVSLDFPARAVTSLLGPTGSGKATQAARIGDRATLFFDGKLVEEGPTEQLFYRRSTPKLCVTFPDCSVTAGSSVSSSVPRIQITKRIG